MPGINIRPVTDLRNNFPAVESDIQSGPVFFTKNGYGTAVLLSLDAYQHLVDPMEAILDETDKIAAADTRRFTDHEVYGRLKDRIHARAKVHA